MHQQAQPPGEERRDNRRVPIDQTRIRINSLMLEFPVVDISTSGLAFRNLRCRFASGSHIGASVHLYGLSLSEKVIVDVVRSEDGVVGCRLIEPYYFGDSIRRVLMRMPS